MLLVPSLWLVFSWMCFLTALVFFLLARWCLDAVSMSCVTIHSDLGHGFCLCCCPKHVNWRARCVLFGDLGDHRAIQGGLRTTGRKTLGSMLGCLSILKGCQDRISRVFGNLWETKCVFCYACSQVTFFNDFGACFWMSGAPESIIWCENCCKKQPFTCVGILLILVSFLPVFWKLSDQF